MWLLRLLKEAIDGDPIPDPPKFVGEIQGKLAAEAVRARRLHEVRADALEAELRAVGYTPQMIDDIVARYTRGLRSAARVSH